MLLPILLTLTSHASDDAWQQTLDLATESIVSIQFDRTRSFDGDGAASSQATGFVVDAERGIILTNRHVVTPGPVIAEAVFENREEVALTPVYRDPVHDFGFYRYDPAELRFAHPHSIPLSPERAKQGVEIRVVGNDAGEKISILAGTLARLDRAAPEYGDRGFNDFNTFYIQAASGTSGGSSGSPVLDIEGHALALNAGGSHQAASSFYLPLTRVQRALELVQAGQPVTRGTIQTVLSYTAYDELDRLGLSDSAIAARRALDPEGTGMLVVSEILPGGPADGRLQLGDVVLSIQGTPAVNFISVESLLDASVDRDVDLVVERGGQPLDVTVHVADLHAVSPASYLEFGGGVLHDLSYHQARNRQLPQRGVFVADQGYALKNSGIPDGSVIIGLDGKAVDDLDGLQTLLEALPDKSTVNVRYFDLDDPGRSAVSVLTVDRHWFGMRRCTRDDVTGTWPCTDAAEAPAPHPLTPSSAPAPNLDAPRRLQPLAESLVVVQFTIPHMTEGVPAPLYVGTGLVLDAERGLVAVDRDTVPIAIGDVRLTFRGILEVPGRVVYLHPVHNVAIVAYDPALIGDTPVRSAPLAPDPAGPGDKGWFLGLQTDHNFIWQEIKVSFLAPATLPVGGPPRFRETNLDMIVLDAYPKARWGVITDKKGRVSAMWSSFAYEQGGKNTEYFAGLPAAVLADALERARSGAAVHDLGVELGTLTLADAGRMGLAEPWLATLADSDKPMALSVVRRAGGTDARDKLRDGDILLAVDGQPIRSFGDSEAAVGDKEQVQVTVFRDGAELTETVVTETLRSPEVTRVLLWAGALLHETHRGARLGWGMDAGGIYSSRFTFGSPAARAGLKARKRIVSVDGVATPDLDAFLAAVSDKQHRDSVRLLLEDYKGKQELVTLRLDLIYFPTSQLYWRDGTWEREDLDHR